MFVIYYMTGQRQTVRHNRMKKHKLHLLFERKRYLFGCIFDYFLEVFCKFYNILLWNVTTTPAFRLLYHDTLLKHVTSVTRKDFLNSCSFEINWYHKTQTMYEDSKQVYI